MVTIERFADSLARYLGLLRQSATEASIRHHCLGFLREVLGITLEQEDGLEVPVFRGRVDAVLGRLVFEFKRDLSASGGSLADAEAQLRHYLRQLHQNNPEVAYTGVAYDGRRFQVYRPVYGQNDPQTDPAVEAVNPRGEATLENIGGLDLEGVSDPQEAYLWLDGLFAHFRSELAIPTARSIVAALGPGSPTFRRLFPELLALYRRVEDAPEVAVRYREWQSYLSIVYGSAVGDPALFIRHTYLSLAARLIARLFLQPGVALTSPEQLAGTVHGGYFREQGIDNFIEDDFFTWLLLPEAREEGLDLVRRLAAALAVYDFRQAGQDLLKGLYEGLVDPEARHDLGEYYTPDWLAEYMLDVELSLSADPGRSVFDPACGSGTFLFTAIRLIAAARLQRGEDPFEVLLHLLDQVMGVDVHPVAVTIARTNYLLALGDLVRGPHPPVLLPVYLSNALVLPGSTAATEPLGGYPEPVHTVHTGEPGLVFELPHSVASNPQMLDWLFARLPQYLAGAELRSRVQDREEAIQAVLVAFHNYLVAPKARTPIPEPLSAFAAEVMERTARRLIELALDGQDHLWVFILKNLPASVYLAQRKFDLVVGNPPWLSMRYIRSAEYRRQVRAMILHGYQLLDPQDTHLFTQMELATLFFARGADLYLKDGGRIALVMPRAVLTAGQHRRFTAFSFKTGLLVLKLERVLDLEGVSPLFNVPACVLVARKTQPHSPGQTEAEGEEIPPGPPLQRGVGGISDKPLQPPTYQGTTYPVPGLVFRGDVPARNASWSEAEPLLERRETSFDRQAGKLVPEGETIHQGPASYYEDKFYNGATLYPRNLWFVHLRRGPLGYDPQRPPLETDPEATRQAKVPWRDVHLSGNVEARFLYATLPSGDLVPFGYTRLRLVVLPVAQEGGRLFMVNRDRAMEQGYLGLSQWLAAAEGHWAAKANRDERGRLRIASALANLDYRRKLTRQRLTNAFKVLYNAAGTNLAAAVIQGTGARSLDWGSDLELSGGFVADHEAYVFETDSQDEAYYLSAVLNSPILDSVIKSSQTRGLWGPRHIHTRPLQLPIPQYAETDDAHRRLAELGQDCHQRVAELLPELAARYRSTGKIRGEVRRLLAGPLAEIDGLVRETLQAAGGNQGGT